MRPFQRLALDNNQLAINSAPVTARSITFSQSMTNKIVIPAIPYRLLRIVRFIKGVIDAKWQYFKLKRADGLSNKIHATADNKFLIIRHSQKEPDYYDLILDWAAEHVPDVRARFELHQLPDKIQDWSRYLLLVPWLQDPVQHWSRKAYQQAIQLETQCKEQHIPIINQVDMLTNASKSIGAGLIGNTGIRTPHTTFITNIQEFKATLLDLDLPLLVREDWGHGENMFYIEKKSDLNDIPLKWLSRPVAVEFIDTKNSLDQLYRKYRYSAIGEEGITQSLHIQKDWLVRGKKCEYSAELIEEELAFLNAVDPNHEQLQRARKALGLDFVAFDYSYDINNKLVVWEANPYPHFHFSKGKRQYRNPSVDRTIAAIIKLYLKKADLPMNPKIESILSQYKKSHSS